MTGDGTDNDVSGVVHGLSIQARDVGGLHLHPPPRTPEVVPRQLPPVPTHFTDRTREIDELSATRLAVLSGPGGVGKTALALRWAHACADRFTDGQLYLDLGAPQQDPLSYALSSLGVDAERIPVRPAERAGLYRTVTAGKALLLLLDDATSEAEVRQLLPGSSRCTVLVTSRYHLAGLVADGARLVVVPVLRPEASLDLLANTVGEQRVSAERGHAEELVDLCGGLPLAVCLLAAKLAMRPRWSLRSAASELADEHHRLAALAVGVDLSIRATFDVSYRALSPRAATLYRRLSLHPGRDFPAAVSVPASGQPPETARQLLDELFNANLTEETVEDRYRLHDLARLHARQQAEDEDFTAQQQVLEWYLAAAMRADLLVTPYRTRLPYEFSAQPQGLPELTDRVSALDWLETERANLMAAAREAFDQGWPELSWQLCDVMWPLLLYRKHYRDRLVIDELGVKAAIEWGSGYAEADMRERLGRVCTKFNRMAEADRHLRQALRYWEMVGNTLAIARSKTYLGLNKLEAGNNREAVALFREVLALARQDGQPRAIGLALTDLALALPGGDEAVALAEEARSILNDLDPTDPYNAARALTAAAHAYLNNGTLQTAATLAAEAVEAMRHIGSDSGEADAMHVQGEAAYYLDDPALARTALRRALDLFTAIGATAKAAAVRERLDRLGSASQLRHRHRVHLPVPAGLGQTQQPVHRGPQQTARPTRHGGQAGGDSLVAGGCVAGRRPAQLRQQRLAPGKPGRGRTEQRVRRGLRDVLARRVRMQHRPPDRRRVGRDRGAVADHVVGGDQRGPPVVLRPQQDQAGVDEVGQPRPDLPDAVAEPHARVKREHYSEPGRQLVDESSQQVETGVEQRT